MNNHNQNPKSVNPLHLTNAFPQYRFMQFLHPEQVRQAQHADLQLLFPQLVMDPKHPAHILEYPISRIIQFVTQFPVQDMPPQSDNASLDR